MVGWYSWISAPACSSSPQSAREALRTTSASMLLAGHDDAHAHAALERAPQRAPGQLVRHEVGRRQVDGLLGRGDRQQVHELHAVAAAAGRAGEHLRQRLARGSQRREISVALQHLAGGLDPVVHEGRLHLRDRRAFEPIVRIAPVLGGLGVAVPVVGDADAAGEADRPSTTSSLRWVRLFMRPRWYQCNGW